MMGVHSSFSMRSRINRIPSLVGGSTVLTLLSPPPISPPPPPPPLPINITSTVSHVVVVFFPFLLLIHILPLQIITVHTKYFSIIMQYAYAQSHLDPVRHLWSSSHHRTHPMIPSSFFSQLPADVLLYIAAHLSTISDALHLSLTVSHYSPITQSNGVDLSGPQSPDLAPHSRPKSTRKSSPRSTAPSTCMGSTSARPRSACSSATQTSLDTSKDSSSIPKRTRITSGTPQRLGAMRVMSPDSSPGRHDSLTRSVRLNGTEKTCFRMSACGPSCECGQSASSEMNSDSSHPKRFHRCPNVRHIGTTFGCFLPRPSSHVSSFREFLTPNHVTNLPVLNVDDCSSSNSKICPAFRSSSKTGFTRMSCTSNRVVRIVLSRTQSQPTHLKQRVNQASMRSGTCSLSAVPSSNPYPSQGLLLYHSMQAVSALHVGHACAH